MWWMSKPKTSDVCSDTQLFFPSWCSWWFRVIHSLGCLGFHRCQLPWSHLSEQFLVLFVGRQLWIIMPTLTKKCLAYFSSLNARGSCSCFGLHWFKAFGLSWTWQGWQLSGIQSLPSGIDCVQTGSSFFIQPRSDGANLAGPTRSTIHPFSFQHSQGCVQLMTGSYPTWS